MRSRSLLGALSTLGAVVAIACSSSNAGNGKSEQGDASGKDGAETGGSAGAGGLKSDNGGHAGATGGASSSAGKSGSGGAGGSTAGSGGTSAGSGGTQAGSGGAGGSASSVRSGGCGKGGISTGVGTKTITVAATSRSYTLSIPAPYDASVPREVIIGLHGVNGNGDGIRSLMNLEAQPGRPTIFAYPNGTNNQWDLSGSGLDFPLFDAVVKELEDSYCVDESRIFVAGFSDGGWMATQVGCLRASVIRGLASVEGGGPLGSGNCQGAVAAWINHGKNDPAEPFQSGVDSRNFWLGKDGCSNTATPSTPSECVAYSGCAPKTPVVFCSYDEALHQWPSYAPAAVRNFFESL